MMRPVFYVAAAIGLSVGALASEYNERELWENDGWDLSPVVNDACRGVSKWTDCADKAEPRFLALYPSVHRDATGLVIELSSGQAIHFDENLSFGDAALRYRYLGMVESLPYHLLWATGSEWHTYWMVNANTGQRTELDSYPAQSPDHGRLAAARFEEFGNFPARLQIFRLQGHSVHIDTTLALADVSFLGSSEAWEVTRPRWIDSVTIKVQARALRPALTGRLTWVDTTAVFMRRYNGWALQ